MSFGVSSVDSRSEQDVRWILSNPSHTQPGAMCERFPPNPPEPPSQPRLICTRLESRRSRRHLCGTPPPPSFGHDLLPRIAASLPCETLPGRRRGCSSCSFPDCPCPGRYTNARPCCRG